MTKIVNLCSLSLIILLLVSCGTREYLGFEKKKIRLEGKRVSILKEKVDSNVIEKKSPAAIILEDAILLSDWPQSYNSPSHLSINHISESNLESFKYVVSGAGEGKKSKILSQPVIYDDFIFFLSEILKNEKKFNLKNFGSFKIIQKKERVGRNPIDKK